MPIVLQFMQRSFLRTRLVAGATCCVVLAWTVAGAVAAAESRVPAPIEDRSPRQEPFGEAQQRVEFTRRNLADTDLRAAQAQQSLQEAERMLKLAEQQAADARQKRDRAMKNLTEARALAAEAKTAHERASADFAKLRR